MNAFYNVNLWAKKGERLRRFTDLIEFPWEETAGIDPVKMQIGKDMLKQLTKKKKLKF